MQKLLSDCMALFMQHKEEQFRWGVWKIDETLDELLELLPNKLLYKEELLHFTSPHRQREWLSVRVLLHALLGAKQISYYPSGKPYLADYSASISISHTRGYVAVILGELGREVGIDIEQYGERIHKVAHKYMRADEIASPYQGIDTWSLLLHWSAKEVLFKCLNESEVDFREHLRVLPFHIAERGVMEAEEYRTSRQQKFTIHYLLSSDFVLTWQNC